MSKVDKITLMIEISIEVALGEKWGQRMGQEEGCLGAGHALFPGMWVVVTCVGSYCENVLSCTLMICELLSRYDRL